jgi:hypothetical protein
MDVTMTISYTCSIALGIIIVLGVVGNILSFIIWSTGSRCSGMSCAHYFRLLALADLYCLVICGIVVMLEISPADIALYNLSNFLCKFYPFSAHFGVQMSSWMVVGVTVERTLSIRYPMKFIHSRSKHRAVSVFIVIIIVAFLLDFMPFWLYEIKYEPHLDPSDGNKSVSNGTSPICVLPNAYSNVFRIWNVYVSFGCFVVALPPVIIIFSNIITLLTLRQHRISGANYHKYENRQSNSISFTYLVIIISVINCISTLPVGYLYIQFDYFTAKSSPVFYRVSMFLFFLNSGTNVIVYCLIGRNFRYDLKQLCKSSCCKSTCQKSNRTSVELQDIFK